MNSEFIEKIKISLLNEKNEILSKSRLVDLDLEGDETDLAQGNLILSIENQLSNRDQIKIRQINVALQKIVENSYGLCDDCGENISEKRLEINPYFSSCISCAEQKEFLKKRNGR